MEEATGAQRIIRLFTCPTGQDSWCSIRERVEGVLISGQDSDARIHVAQLSRGLGVQNINTPWRHVTWRLLVEINSPFLSSSPLQDQRSK